MLYFFGTLHLPTFTCLPYSSCNTKMGVWFIITSPKVLRKTYTSTSFFLWAGCHINFFSKALILISKFWYKKKQKFLFVLAGHLHINLYQSYLLIFRSDKQKYGSVVGRGLQKLVWALFRVRGEGVAQIADCQFVL